MMRAYVRVDLSHCFLHLHFMLPVSFPLYLPPAACYASFGDDAQRPSLDLGANQCMATPAVDMCKYGHC
eukprot:3016442-Rhodomonas_salina.1